MNIKNIRTIIKKELKLYFNSPIAYIVIIIFLLLCGFFYSRPLFVQGYVTLRHFFDILVLFLLFFVPAVSMKIFSEEYKTATIEVIYTLPFYKIEILLGKYLASLIIILIGITLTLFYPFTLLFLGRLDLTTTFAGYLGVIFLVIFFNSVGIFSSSLTKNQIVSFIISFFILFIFFAIGKMGFFVSDIISYVGIDMHYDNFIRGIVDLRDVVYFTSLSLLFLYFTYLSIQRQR
ncbi:MAG: ABC transporter permease [Endomicrobiia bacterium]